MAQVSISTIPLVFLKSDTFAQMKDSSKIYLVRTSPS